MSDIEIRFNVNVVAPGYQFEIGGEEEQQVDGFGNLSVVLAIFVVVIFLALTFPYGPNTEFG
jgi:multidrug efflux pump subunit AcrB